MMNGTMRHEILRSVRCSRSLVIHTSLETGEHTSVVRVVSSAFLFCGRHTAEHLMLFLPSNQSYVFQFRDICFQKTAKNAAKLHLVRASPLTECARGYPNLVPEGGREVGLAAKAQAATNFGQRELAVE